MLSHLLGTEREKERLIQASQSMHNYTHRYFSATNTVICTLNQHLNSNFPLVQVKKNLSVLQNFILLIDTVQEIHATVELTDRHVQKNIGHPLYDKITLSHTSLQEKGVIVRDFHTASMGIFGSICGPITSVLLRNGNLPEKLESAVQLMKGSPVLALPVANLLLSCNEIAMAISEQAFLQLFPGQLPRSTLEAAADEMERVVLVLRDSYESFQYVVSRAEVYVTLITINIQGFQRKPLNSSQYQVVSG
uniref:Uncharacterized protein n=1 Tax=Pelusios castaneus TaxID=367368 RepID=A0A8C8RET2_9SAUR